MFMFLNFLFTKLRNVWVLKKVYKFEKKYVVCNLFSNISSIVGNLITIFEKVFKFVKKIIHNLKFQDY
jgi:hypothetical protein